MGLTAIVSTVTSVSSSVSSAAVSASVTSMLSPVGAGIGGVFAAAALVVLLAHFDLHRATETGGDDEMKRTLVGTILPLVVVFGSVVLFKTLQLL